LAKELSDKCNKMDVPQQQVYGKYNGCISFYNYKLGIGSFFMICHSFLKCPIEIFGGDDPIIDIKASFVVWK
jgi:hypothetical protein